MKLYLCLSQPAVTCSESTVETPKQYVKYIFYLQTSALELELRLELELVLILQALLSPLP